jgi:hypothetical protein
MSEENGLESNQISRGERAAALLPDLRGANYKIAIRNPVRLGLLTVAWTWVTAWVHANHANGVFTTFAMFWEVLIVSWFVLIIALQLEFTIRWSLALSDIHQALGFYTEGNYPVSTDRAVNIGFFSSPIFIPFLAGLGFVIAAIATNHTQLLFALLTNQHYFVTGPSLEGSILALLSLVILSNAMTVGTLVTHFYMLRHLIRWINDRTPEEDRINETLSLILPLGLVFPTWWAIWNVPSPISLIYFFFYPLAIGFSLSKLSMLTARLRTIMAPTQEQLTPVYFPLPSRLFDIVAFCLCMCAIQFLAQQPKPF